MQTVEIVADSIGPFGNRITTVKATFWRALLAEVNTHRMLTRNSASSRAIRFKKMVESVMNNSFIPLKWQKDHSGMQGTEYFDGPDVTELGLHWLAGRDQAVAAAQRLNELGLTKQLCNRLLEPFMYHTALITGTEFENFVALRAHADAEIHFQDLAYKFLDAMNASTPKQLQPGEWHIPFGDSFDNATLLSVIPQDKKYRPEGMLSSVVDDETLDMTMVKLATVRCARISYVVPGSEQKINYAADLELHDRLAAAGHMSAFEHCARAMTTNEYHGPLHWAWGEPGWCKNFRGFIQYRAMFPNENRSDLRLLKK